MFKTTAEWDVDKDAEYLNTSLFGNSKKCKVPIIAVQASANNGSRLHSSILPDSDDEQYSKNDKKRLKKMRKKNKNHEKSEDSTMSKKKYDLAMEVPQRKLKVNTSLIKVDSPIANVKNKKAKQKGKLNENITHTSSLTMTKEQNSKKRKRSLSDCTDSSIITIENKKAKFEENKNVLSTDDVTATEDGKKKRKRNRTKKNNSKKNKYKHLAQNSQNKTGNSDAPLGISSVDTNKEAADNKISHPALESSSNKSPEYAHINTSSQKAGQVQKQKTKKGKKISGSSDVLVLGENKRQDPKLSLPHTDNSPKTVLPQAKKMKKTSANISQLQSVRKSSESDTLSSAISNASIKKKVKKQQMLLKMLNGTHKDKPDKIGVKDHGGFTSRKMNRKIKEVDSVPDITKCDPPRSGKHTFKNNAEIGGKQGNISLDIEKSPVTAPPVAHSIWGKAVELGQQAREKLNSARFRYINEQLYSCKSDEALTLFREDHDAFSVYHEGFQNQASKWPVNPLDVFIKQIRDKPKNLIIADFGCGDAKLAQNIPQKVHSFDLVALNNRVTACDMSKTPIPKEQVDVAVFCLSLMGTNIVDYIVEANRVLKTGGLLKIAEVVSRFSGLSRFTDGVCSCGFQLLNKRDLNQMFYIMDFKKVKSVKKSASLPAIKLKPCIYKRR